MVPPYSDKVSRAPPYFSSAQYHTSLFTYRTITCYGRPFHAVLLRVMLSLTGFSDFARHYFRNLGWFLFLELLRCFSSPGSPPTPMYSVWDTFRWVSPFGYLRIKAYLPAPRSFSQAITSFVAYHCQGIHHMLLFTWLYNFDFSFEIALLIKECFVWSFTKRVMPYQFTINFWWLKSVDSSQTISFEIESCFDAIKKICH